MKELQTPLTSKELHKLKAGDEIALSGVIYTARDAAHKRMIEALAKGRSLPVKLKGEIIYYCGPTPAKTGSVIGSCGPTTSLRMDSFTVKLLKLGLKGMIGKGRRSQKIKEAVKDFGAVYFLALGGLGALLSKSVITAKAIAYKDLGPEAIYRLEVVDFPLIVGVDTKGRSIYDSLRPKRK